jgi:hypothetical protein
LNPCSEARAFIASNESSGYAFASFELIATSSKPRSPNSRWSAIIRPSHA